MVVNLQEKIKVIQDLCQKVNNLVHKWGSDEQKAAHKAFWKAIGDLELEAGPGLQPGKLVKFAVADNYARYIVEKVGRRNCKLVHLNYMDGYRSPAVNDRGECWTEEVRGQIEFEEGLRWILARGKEKKLKPDPVEP